MSFERDVRRIAERMKARAEEVVQATIIELFIGTVRLTPVDTGRLQGNWQVTTNIPASGEIARTGSGGPIFDIYGTVTRPGLFYLTNNLPYAEVVEFGQYGTGPYATAKTGGTGYSIQAPAGMVRVNARRVRSVLRKRAR